MKLKRNMAISDSGFIFEPGSGNSFTTNPIGLEIIELLKQGKTEEQIISHLTGHYAVDAVTCKKDLYDFMNVLAKLKLTDGDVAQKN